MKKLLGCQVPFVQERKCKFIFGTKYIDFVSFFIYIYFSVIYSSRLFLSHLLLLLSFCCLSLQLYTSVIFLRTTLRQTTAAGFMNKKFKKNLAPVRCLYTKAATTNTTVSLRIKGESMPSYFILFLITKL